MYEALSYLCVGPYRGSRTHLQVLQVLQQPLRHSSVLHLNHYLLPVFQHRPVHLRDRGSIRLYQGAITALLRRYYSSIKALLMRC